MSALLASLLAVRALTAPLDCRPAPAGQDPQTLLDRSAKSLGLSSVSSRVRTSKISDVLNMPFQSDRMYPPYLWTAREMRSLMDWERGTHKLEQGTAPNGIAFVSDSARKAAISPRAAQILAARTPSLLDERAMDPWAVLADWRGASDARVAEECLYRDYWRTVLTRATAEGPERLYVDPKTSIPVKLDRRESHYLWGDVHVEYLWSIWTPVKGTQALAPQFAFRMVDGEVDQQRYMEGYAIVSRDSAGSMEIPASAAPQMAPPPLNVDTVRVAANTFLLVTRAYTNVVTLQRDTVFILDAQTSGDRAQRDSVWIGKLFPGRHPLVLVVTDLAWPHIAGVRYWVANGARVVSHPASRDFLKRVVERKWTLHPDALERRRAQSRLTFIPVDGARALAGGAIQLRPIDGIGSEGALLAFLPAERFLYAGDYIQPGGPDSFSATYAREVAAAVARAGFSPEHFAAMHTPLTNWSSLSRFTGQP